MAKMDAVLIWLRDEGRLQRNRVAFVEALAAQMRLAGFPVDRMTTGIPILHPNFDSTSVRWVKDEGGGERSWPMAPENYVMRANSPLHAAYFEGRSTRSAITPEPVEGEFGIIPDLRADGYTDYVCVPIPFSDGSNKAMTFATKEEAGFSDEDLVDLEGLAGHVGAVLELQTVSRKAETLLGAYLGEQVSARVLDGQIRRGDAEEIHAVIWFSDLRGSTPLAEAMEPTDFLQLLNRYLECMAEAVLNHQGEVLRFIGDAALGIFPITPKRPLAKACSDAVDAALESIQRMEAINASRADEGEAPVEFGVGLHVGDVLYGNIGAAHRLEITVIGAAANEAARIEGMCTTLDQRLLFSQGVADQIEGQKRDLGAHALKGVGAPIRLFTVGPSD
jgi:adenylate cyclase